MQVIVHQRPIGVVEHEFYALHRLRGLRPAERQFHIQLARSRRAVGNNEILSYAVHAHAVFFGESRAEKGGDFPPCGDGASSRQGCGVPIPSDGAGDKPQATASVGGGVKPESIAGDRAREFLEGGAQLGALGGGADADGIALVIRRGFGSELGKWDWRGCGRGVRSHIVGNVHPLGAGALDSGDVADHRVCGLASGDDAPRQDKPGQNGWQSGEKG